MYFDQKQGSEHLIAAVFALAILGVFPAQAQEPVSRPPDTARNRVLLADTLGAVHYLTTVCVGRQDQSWRNHMSEMLQLESLSSYERQDLIAAFNHGYRQEQQYYPVCTPQTVSRIGAKKRFKAEQGQILSTALADPYLH